MIRWLTIIVVVLLIGLVAVYVLRGKPRPPVPSIAWTNPEAGYYFATVVAGASGPMVEGKDAVHQLDPLTGEILSSCPAIGCNLSQGPDGKGVIETDGKLLRPAFPEGQQLIDLGVGIKRIEILPSGEFTGQTEEKKTALYNSVGKPVWPAVYMGTLLALDTSSNIYGHTFGWVYGIDRKTGKVAWDDRSEIRPQPLDKDVVILRGSHAKVLNSRGKVQWSTNLGEKLIDARVYENGIYVLSEGKVFQLSRSGKLRWKQKSEGANFRAVSQQGLAVLQVTNIDMSKDGIRFQNPADRESYKLVAWRPDGKLLWSWNTKDGVHGAAVQSDAGKIAKVPAERVYVSTFEAVMALDPPRK